MNLNSLLVNEGIEPSQVLVMRHAPEQDELRRAFPWLAAEHPEIFNAYQQTQKPKQEVSLKRPKYLASFIGHKPGEALFVGLYKVDGSRSVSGEEFWRIRAMKELRKYGLTGGPARNAHCLWFNLELTEFRKKWKGKLIVTWPPPEKAWYRWADRNEFPVEAIVEESLLARPMPKAEKLTLSWQELQLLPKSWRTALAQWRGIYLIFDVSDCKSYVGAAYGKDNLYSRWLNYAKKGHGGNKQLRKRRPDNFRFSVLELVSQSASPEDVIRVESTWKNRLHTREFGLNEN